MRNFVRFAALSAVSVLAFAGSALAQQAEDVVNIQVNGRQIQITNAKVTAVSSGVFAGNTATVGLGATITVQGDYVIFPSNNPADFSCPNCFLQTYIAWTPAAAAAGASPINLGLWFGLSEFPGDLLLIDGSTSGTFSFTTTAPTTPGFYTIAAGESLDFNFIPNATGVPGYDLAIGVVGSPIYSNFLISVTNAPPASCPGDADNNGAINFADITSVLANFNLLCN